MKTEKLILNYQRRGIKLSVSDNKLHFSAPQNILTDEDKDILKKNKKEIIKFLKCSKIRSRIISALK